jgi:hypothetical protein
LEKVTTSVTSSNEDVYRLFRQSVEDIAALRLWERTEARNGFIPRPAYLGLWPCSDATASS